MAESVEVNAKKARKRREKIREFFCCPVCRGPLKLTGLSDSLSYVCSKDGKYEIDSFGRPFLIKEDVRVDRKTLHESGVNRLKSFLKMSPRIYYSIWHVFCPVMMLRHGPRSLLKHIKDDEVIIDIGSGPERLGDRFVNLDVFPFPEVDIVSDAECLPFKDSSVSAMVTESMLEHVPNPESVAREMVRVLKKGGVLYASAPFVHPYHASPDDFHRWSMSGLKGLFEGLEIVESGVRSGPWSAFLMFLAYWLGVVFSFGSRRVAPFMAHVFMLVLGPLKYLDFLFIDLPGAEAVAAHLYIIARKNKIKKDIVSNAY